MKKPFTAWTLKDLLREEVQSFHNLNDREVQSFHNLASRMAEEERERRFNEKKLSVSMRKFKSVGRINTGNHHNVIIEKKGGK